MVKLNPPPPSSRELEDPNRCKRARYCHLYLFFLRQLDMTYCSQHKRWGGPGVTGGHQWRRHDETGLACSIRVAVGWHWYWVLGCHRGHRFSLSQVEKSRVRCTLLEFIFCSLTMLAEVSGYPDRALFLACFVVHTCERLFKSWWRCVRNVCVTTCSEPPYSHGATAGSSISGSTIGQFSWWWWYSVSVHRLLDLKTTPDCYPQGYRAIWCQSRGAGKPWHYWHYPLLLRPHCLLPGHLEVEEHYKTTSAFRCTDLQGISRSCSGFAMANDGFRYPRLKDSPIFHKSKRRLCEQKTAYSF